MPKEKTKRKRAKNNKQPFKVELYNKFIEWYNEPSTGEMKKQWPKHQDFAKAHKLNNGTLSQWKNREDFREKSNGIKEEWGRGRTPNVMSALYKRCVTYGMASDVELWLAYFEKWHVKQVIEHHEVHDFTKNDVFQMIKFLPKEKQKQFHDLIDKLISEADAAIASGQVANQEDL